MLISAVFSYRTYIKAKRICLAKVHENNKKLRTPDPLTNLFHRQSNLQEGEWIHSKPSLENHFAGSWFLISPNGHHHVFLTFLGL